jgi:hypothetical protein
MFKKVLRIVGMVIGGACLGVLIAFLFGWVLMLLWNWLMPSIFGLPVITFWKAWGLIILAHILFKSGHHGRFHHWDRHSRPEWKEKFRGKMRAHFQECCSPEGEKASS